MGSLGGALEFAEGPAAQGYPAQWWKEQIAWCGSVGRYALHCMVNPYGLCRVAASHPEEACFPCAWFVCMYWMDGMEGGGRSMDSANPENLHLHKEQTPVGR